MKNLKTGEITPPLPHDEYAAEFEKRVEAERDAKANRGKVATRTADVAKAPASKQATDGKK